MDEETRDHEGQGSGRGAQSGSQGSGAGRVSVRSVNQPGRWRRRRSRDGARPAAVAAVSCAGSGTASAGA